MINLKNKTALEFYFADHFDTVLFPVLADIYLKEDDLIRAKKVCEIGLGYNPKHAEGLYTFARVHLAEGNLKGAEKVLITLLNTGSIHLQGYIMLAGIQKKLKRGVNTIESSWKEVLKIDPHHSEGLEYLQKLKKRSKSGNKTKKKNTRKKSLGTPKPMKAEDLESLSISPKLATFTLVKVLEDQGLFYQALDVLDILEKKGKNIKRITLEKIRIQNCLPHHKD